MRTFFDAGNEVVKRANVPAQFAVLQRINLGLYAVLAGLGATADWRRIAEEIWPFVDAPASTDLGRRGGVAAGPSLSRRYPLSARAPFVPPLACTTRSRRDRPGRPTSTRRPGTDSWRATTSACTTVAR